MYALLTALSLALVGQADAVEKRGEKEDAEFAKTQQKKWNESYRTEAATYAISLNGDRQKTLKMQPEPVLLWSNPVRYGETNGAVFVWTFEGRVEAVGTVFSHLARQEPDKRFTHRPFLPVALARAARRRAERNVGLVDQSPGHST